MSTISPLSTWGWGLGRSGQGWRRVLGPDCSLLPWVEREVGPRGVDAVPWTDGKFPAPWESALWGVVGGLESICVFSSG